MWRKDKEIWSDLLKKTTQDADLQEVILWRVRLFAVMHVISFFIKINVSIMNLIAYGKFIIDYFKYRIQCNFKNHKNLHFKHNKMTLNIIVKTDEKSLT